MMEWYAIENADEVPSPALLVYPDRIRENLRRLISLAGGTERLRPHVKTHKMPQIIQMKRELGIKKFKASTIAEAEMTASAGGEDILLAYQPVGPNIRRFLELMQSFPATRFSTLVDNPQTLAEISSMAATKQLNVELFVDLNVGMNRTGISIEDGAIELYRQLYKTANVTAAGLHAYDGHLHDADLERLKADTELAFKPVWEMMEKLAGEGIPVRRMVAAGTPTTSLLAKFDSVEVGAGTPVLWDFGQCDLSPDLDFQNAAVLLARVISRPTTNRICIDLGHKAVAAEMSPPRVRFFGLENAVPVMHSEEHLVLEVPDSRSYPVGTVLYGIPRHICPTVALHHEVRVIREHRAMDAWSVVARKRCITI
jgi:D-threonine aldolase